ncbi:putative lipid II flippase FtsW [Pseudoxanthomonas sp. SGNA-20]|uniref:putative lipid II flippase FtsW n=1 Tax=Pseudoxanthomonas sp. SGNA-20 TaxID=2493088 RepID=UPI000F63499E|nr:putative lipid II flippase FtsW [Pseudoxanthomonas sp. SGNA-20]RRN58812.1 putative lipid II flippase FtsW [Pseudoxanthomonas sp. SGNA-20]
MNDLSRQATRLEAIGGRYDPWLCFAVLALGSLGVVMVASASIAIAENLGAGPFHYLVRHVLFVMIGAVLAVVAMRTELKLVEKYNQQLLLCCFLLLLLPWLPGLGVSVNGARRWINLGLSRFQVVEAVKVIYIVWLASYLVRFRDEVNATWPAMLKPLGVAVLLVGMLLAQPDFGSATLLLGITAGMLVLGGVNLPRMSAPILVLLPALVAIAIIEPYRLRRITSFMDPWQDQLGAGYQLSNALMAVGRGEWFGVGLGASVQKLNYLPEAHTDFIFSVIAEELGFVGVCGVIGLYVLLVGRALYIGMKCVEMRRHFAGYIAFGVGLWLGMQSFVSIGVNLGLLPTKGLTLPLISSGGSSVMMTCAAIGLLLRVSYELERAERQVARLRPESIVPVAAADAPAAPSAPLAARPAPPRTTPRATPAGGRGTSRVEPTFGGFA